jgi:RND family efflux transporter MFP subunit
MTEQRHAVLALHAVDADPHELLTRRQILRATRIAALVVLLLLGIGAAHTVFVRIANAGALAAEATGNARQYVKTGQAKRGGAQQTLSLPGTLTGQQQSPISARASGYLKRWTRDIGSVVRKGELLAEIETPEIDQQLGQALAARDQAAAGLALTRSTAQRWEGLRLQDVVSQQDLDEKRNAVTQSQANLAAAEANVQRLRQLENFKRVVAPFAGVITQRNVDTGGLIDGSRPLFVLSQTDLLRVVVAVPQAFAHRVTVGQAVVVTQGELAGRKFPGQVARTAAAIDPATRTMQVEIALTNADGRLLPGAYVQVALPLSASTALVAPTNALLFRAEGASVAVVDAQGRVVLRRVGVGRNFGETFEVLAGLTESDRLVLNPPDGLADGQVVVAVPSAAPAAAASAAASAASGGKS